MRILLILTWSALAASMAGAEDPSVLRARIAALEAELAAARAELARQSEAPAPEEAEAPRPLEAAPEVEIDPPEDDALRIGDFTVGGAVRVNWVLGDYDTGVAGPSRGGHGGDFELDTFRLDLDYERENVFGRAEYRWYPGTNFFHTLELGVRHGESSTLRAGLTRVPFGVGPYGPANSWFFDQHYYVGLADDMDLGIVHTTERGPWTIDLGLFASSPPDFRGSGDGGARYSFDIVDARGDPNYFGNVPPTAYEERGQANLRVVRSFTGLAVPTDLGVSLQYGRLDGHGGAADAWPMAASVHSLSSLGAWELKLQATHYDYGNAEDHISGGFYGYTTNIAAEGTLLSAALSYTWETPVDWLDSITFYNDFSVIRKHAPGYRSSALNVLGAAFAKDGWFIYADWAYSNGNQFVGTARPGMWARNAGQSWRSRFNLNFGYYF